MRSRVSHTMYSHEFLELEIVVQLPWQTNKQTCYNKVFCLYIHTSCQVDESTSNSHASFSMLLSISHPPVTSSWGCSSPKLRQHALWADRTPGHGTPPGLESFLQCYIATWISESWFHAYVTCKSCWHGVKQHQQFTSGCHHTWYLQMLLSNVLPHRVIQPAQ